MKLLDGGKFASAVLACVVALGAPGCGRKHSNEPNVSMQRVVLSGAEENPAVTTAAAATGTFSIDRDSGAVSGSIMTTGVTATAAHIHEAAPGVNGPVIIPLVQDPPGTWAPGAGAMLTQAQLASLEAGNLYVNVHSAANPTGEIRAQIGRQLFYATLTGAHETPPVATAAAGTGRFVFDPATRMLSGTVATTGIAATAAHVHTGAIGVAGPITFPLAGGPADWTLSPTMLTEAQALDLANGSLYANVHSAVNPGGEIRGQLFTPLRVTNLAGAFETPPVTTSATGMGWLSVNPFTKGVAGRIETTLTLATAAHVHRAPVGVAGPIVIPLSSPSPGVWVTSPGTSLSDDLLASFMKGELYFNVHSAAFPAGEIRGQLASAP